MYMYIYIYIYIYIYMCVCVCVCACVYVVELNIRTYELMFLLNRSAGEQCNKISSQSTRFTVNIFLQHWFQKNRLSLYSLFFVGIWLERNSIYKFFILLFVFP